VLNNFGCTKFVIGQTHAGLGMHYDKQKSQTILNELIGIDIKTQMVSEFVYCNECKTLVTTGTCPHGAHHHISYHAQSILELLKVGLLPPAVLVRKELSAMILSTIFPNRFKNISVLYNDLIPNNGIIEDVSEEDFYKKLMKLYQTSSLT
jgi:sulfate adenylyltransferase